MSIISVNELTFSYHTGTAALSSVSLEIEEGSFVTICGASGCGKSTLLRLLKPALAPRGKATGKILYDGTPLGSVPLEKAAAEIGFVMQDPEAQLVTDKVWHELSFSAESVGLPVDEIRRRVAEMASYFGLEELFERDCASLSGGQKQLLNLAGAAALHPRVLLLDEPTSQLDPIAAQSFIDSLSRLNRDLGMTIVIAEHRLEELLHISDKVVVMDKGKVIIDCPPHDICKMLPKEHMMMSAMPAAVRVFAMAGGGENAPLSVREGRSNTVCRNAIKLMKPLPCPERSVAEPIITAKALRVGFNRNAPDVLKRADISICSGSIYAILGGNGSGKTTLLKCIADIIRPISGKIKRKKGISCAYLPQNPCEIFTEDTVRAELMAVSRECEDMTERFGLTHLADSHPYDISGGERQRLAIAKLMLKKPDVLLMDEPTKGMDAFSKASLCGILKSLSESGVAVLLVTHDTEFAAQCADVCGLLFNGEISGEAPPQTFMSENYFYTTPVRRLTRGITEGIVTIEGSVYGKTDMQG
ncbi:MAG: ATP-binding cassette domain-containing protein [Oscillospiraceae bacterium]|nr:ATP-binding cassette domain-containing protein [Oscillospiraceae bacterium]